MSNIIDFPEAIRIKTLMQQLNKTEKQIRDLERKLGMLLNEFMDMCQAQEDIRDIQVAHGFPVDQTIFDKLLE